jgi:hypothetical protein
VWAASNPRRELWVGWPTVQAIVSDKLVPGLLDRYLARTAYDSQMLDEPVEPGRDDNLFDPVRGGFGAHGPFDRSARPQSLQLWLAMNRRWVGAGVATALAALAWGARRRG